MVLAGPKASYFPPLTECWHEDKDIDIDMVIEGQGAFLLDVPSMSAVLKNEINCDDDRKAFKACEARECDKTKVPKAPSILTNPWFWAVVGVLVVGGTVSTIAAHEAAKP